MVVSELVKLKVGRNLNLLDSHCRHWWCYSIVDIISVPSTQNQYDLNHYFSVLQCGLVAFYQTPCATMFAMNSWTSEILSFSIKFDSSQKPSRNLSCLNLFMQFDFLCLWYLHPQDKFAPSLNSFGSLHLYRMDLLHYQWRHSHHLHLLIQSLASHLQDFQLSLILEPGCTRKAIYSWCLRCSQISSTNSIKQHQ